MATMDSDSTFEILTTDKVYETELETVRLLWRPNFQMVPPNFSGPLNSFDYLASNTHVGGYSVGNPCEWCIQFNPTYMEKGKRYISIFLWVPKFLRKDKPPGKQSVHAMYQFTVKWFGGGFHSKFSSIHKFTEKTPCYGFKKFIPFPKVIGPRKDLNQRSMFMLISATIMILRDINDFVFPSTIEDKYCLLNSDGNNDGESAFPTTDVEGIEKRRKLHFVNHAIQENISELRKSKKFADVIIRSAKKEHHAHMAILLARRKTTESIPFQTENIHNKEMKIIDMKDVADCTVSRVLDFCYDGYTKHFSHYKNIFPIFQVANKFQLIKLRNQCLIELACSITPKYFIHILKIAFTFPMEKEVAKPIMEFLRHYYVANRQEIRDGIKVPNRGQAQWYLIQLFL